MKFLAFGDVSGRVGRASVTQALPDLRKQYQPDAIIINVENMAHGFGVSLETMQEALTWQADVYTTGDHAWDNEQATQILEDKAIPIVRPANYPDGVPGRGYHIFSSGAYQVAVINLQGQVFFKNQPRSPFEVIDELLKIPEVAAAHIKLVDFQAEATSEKRALAWYADGKISALWGTHTHVPTADAQILPNGTGYISDLGMCGAYHSIIGMAPEGPLKMFKTQLKTKFAPPEEGPGEIGGVFLEIDPKSGQTIRIEHIRQIVNNSK